MVINILWSANHSACYVSEGYGLLCYLFSPYKLFTLCVIVTFQKSCTLFFFIHWLHRLLRHLSNSKLWWSIIWIQLWKQSFKCIAYILSRFLLLQWCTSMLYSFETFVSYVSVSNKNKTFHCRGYFRQCCCPWWYWSGTVILADRCSRRIFLSVIMVHRSRSFFNCFAMSFSSILFMRFIFLFVF